MRDTRTSYANDHDYCPRWETNPPAVSKAAASNLGTARVLRVDRFPLELFAPSC